jgi:Cytochrome c3
MKSKNGIESYLSPLFSLSLFVVFTLGTNCFAAPPSAEKQDPLGDYIAIGWNDLGMHCMNLDYEGMCILPPFNNLWVQVVKRGNPPELISEGVELDYSFPDNTDSVSKINFWEYDQDLFGVDLPDNVGLTGNGLTGTLEWNGTAFEVTGVPLTPFDDAAPTIEQPYQIVKVTLKSSVDQSVLDETQFVAPVSTEMNCGQCHDGDDKKKNPPLTEFQKSKYQSVSKLTETKEAKQLDPEVVWRDILDEHDDVDGQSLLDQTPVLCASCHSSNALGTAGRPELDSLSLAIHKVHAEKYPTLDCYACHPGSQTQCLRGAMYIAGQSCQDCHGNLTEVANSIKQGRRPWIDEPKCITCHPAHGENPGQLYRNSVGHGGMYCTACHGSPHAELPSAQSRDGIQALRLQGMAKALSDCSVCHTVTPQAPGPHGLEALPFITTEWLIK